MNFQPEDPPDVEPDWDEIFDRYEKNGYAVIDREEWKQRLDDAATDGYAEGRSDEREEWAPVLAALQPILRFNSSEETVAVRTSDIAAFRAALAAKEQA